MIFSLPNWKAQQNCTTTFRLKEKNKFTALNACFGTTEIIFQMWTLAGMKKNTTGSS